MKCIWQITVKCALTKGVWRLTQADKWGISDRTPEAGSTLPKPLKNNPQPKPLASIIKSNWEKVQEAFGDEFALPELDEGGKIWWLAQGGDDPIVTEPVSMVLNQLVASESLRSCEILTSIVREHMTVNIRGIQPGYPCWSYTQLDSPVWRELLDEYVLSFPHLFLNSVDEKGKTCVPHKAKQVQRRVKGLLEAHRFLHRYRVRNYKFDEIERELTVSWNIETIMAAYPKGNICDCIPIPGKSDRDREYNGDEPYSVRSPEVVLTSPNVVRSLEELSRVWHDRFARSILVTGPPGSGKENFARSIPYGSGRDANRIRVLSLATANSQSLERQLFGQQQEDGSVKPGLIAQASNSALFLDEAHQAPEGVLAGLLRPMEAEEYLPVNSNEVQKVEDVLFVLATSLPWKGDDPKRTIRGVGPPDLWTRMTDIIEIKHPLQLEDDINTKKATLESFFKFFWWDRVTKYFRVEPPLSAIEPDVYEVVGDVKPHPKKLQRHGYLVTLLAPSKLEKMAQAFSSLLGDDKDLENLSIRGLRSMASLMFSLVVRGVQGGDPLPDEIETLNQLKDHVIPKIKTIASIAPIDDSSS